MNNTLYSIKHLQLMANGIINESPEKVDSNLILKSLKTNDEYLIKNLNNKIQTTTMAKNNLMYYILKNGIIKQKYKNDYEEVFDFIKALNKLFIINGFSAFKFKIIKSKDIGTNLIIQSSILKDTYYEKQHMVDDLVLLFERSKIKIDFMKLTNKRFSKTIDLLYLLADATC